MQYGHLVGMQVVLDNYVSFPVTSIYQSDNMYSPKHMTSCDFGEVYDGRFIVFVPMLKIRDILKKAFHTFMVA